MVIAGEASGDSLAAELVLALRGLITGRSALPTDDYQPLETGLAPRFFGAGGPRMAAAGVELALDPTRHSVTGISGVLENFLHFRRAFRQLYRLALERQPDAIVCVDFSEFNRLFAHAIRRAVRSRRDWFHDWDPRIIRYVSPQVWASREGRVYGFARDHDLILSLFAFEPEWYARRVPRLKVQFVGHPIIDRHLNSALPLREPEFEPSVRPEPAQPQSNEDRNVQTSSGIPSPASPRILLLPGSRQEEVSRHLPPMLGAVDLLAASYPGLRTLLVLADDGLLDQARASGLSNRVQVQAGGLAEALQAVDLAIASTGTVTLECAYWGVPTVAMYKTSWSNYQIAKRLVQVKYLAMPNLLAEEEVFPEFIQGAATAPNLARAAFQLLRDPDRRAHIKAKLTEVKAALGPPGASQRAAQAILQLLGRI
jgi:lipid-A-disaccharide synthase